MQVLQGKVICKKPMDPIYNILALSAGSRNCSMTERLCGNLNGFSACIPSNVSCPINDLKIVPNEKTNDDWNYTKFSETHKIGHSSK
jgi:hypothetical protein